MEWISAADRTKTMGQDPWARATLGHGARPTRLVGSHHERTDTAVTGHVLVRLGDLAVRALELARGTVCVERS